jgi:glutathione S-transferase
MKLYSMPGACSRASQISLDWVGAKYELVALTHPELSGDTFRRINPNGCVPALVLDDGTVITQSLAVLLYIAEAFPNAQLGAEPSDLVGRAKLIEMLAELVSDVHKAWSPVFAPQRYVLEKGHQEEARQAAYGQLDKQYSRLNQQMQDKEFCLFGRRTVVDAYLYVMCTWKDKTPQPLGTYPALAAFKKRLDGMSGVEA